MPTRRFFVIVIVVLLMPGCRGTAVLDEPITLQTTKPLAISSSAHLQIVLDWIVIPNGPGSWAKGVEWDEYLVSVQNLTQRPIFLQELVVVDTLGVSIDPRFSRPSLVTATEEAKHRYADLDIAVESGMGGEAMMATGGVVTLGAAGALAASTTAIALGAGGATAATLAGGLLVLGPALIIGGAVTESNEREVNSEIRRRRTDLPLELLASKKQLLHVFFPVTPSPQKITLSYYYMNSLHEIEVDTRAALTGLHLVEEEQ